MFLKNRIIFFLYFFISFCLLFFYFHFLHISLFRWFRFISFPFRWFRFVSFSLISFRFVSFSLISFRFVSFLFRFALYRYPLFSGTPGSFREMLILPTLFVRYIGNSNNSSPFRLRFSPPSVGLKVTRIIQSLYYALLYSPAIVPIEGAVLFELAWRQPMIKMRQLFPVTGNQSQCSIFMSMRNRHIRYISS